MPYIPRKDRPQYQEAVQAIAKLIPQDRNLRPGHMNYVLSLLIEKVYGREMRYADHNEVMGLLTCVAEEFYRRKSAPYEDKKVKDEGDLHEL
jgi:hypothetical protein